MIWIIGEYAERIDNADELLEQFLETFPEETSLVLPCTPRLSHHHTCSTFICYGMGMPVESSCRVCGGA